MEKRNIYSMGFRFNLPVWWTLTLVNNKSVSSISIKKKKSMTDRKCNSSLFNSLRIQCRRWIEKWSVQDFHISCPNAETVINNASAKCIHYFSLQNPKAMPYSWCISMVNYREWNIEFRDFRLSFEKPYSVYRSNNLFIW